jgi:arylsulfatase A-like enzyme
MIRVREVAGSEKPRGRCCPSQASALLLSAMFAITACTARNEDQPPAPVVLITVDTTRADHLPIYGYDKPTAPNLSTLANNGIVFQNFVTMSSWTLPSHASLFTGLHSATHTAHYNAEGSVALSDALEGTEVLSRFRANRLPGEALTLAEVLRDEGYTTIGVGAGPWLKPVFGLDQGFQFYDAESDSKSGRSAEDVNRLALKQLEQVGEDPFLLFLNYFDPHDPYEGPGEDWRRFLAPGSDSKVAKTLAHYDAEIFYMDRYIGEMLNELRRRGLYDASWIVVTSDHGELFGEHRLDYHGFSLHEEVIRGVLIVKPPAGVQLALDPTERSQTVDIMPTLLAGLAIERSVPTEGQPLGSKPRPVVAELYRNPGTIGWRGKKYDRDLRAVYQGNYKLVVSTLPNDRHSGLFDLALDPREEHNLLEKKPGLARSLRASLDAWEAGLLPRLTPDTVENVAPATQHQLEALGYLPSDDPQRPPPSQD